MLKLPFFSKNSISLSSCISRKLRIESMFSCVHSSLPSASNGRTILPRSSDPELKLSSPESKIKIFFSFFSDKCKPMAAPRGPFPMTMTSNSAPETGGGVKLSLTIASPQENSVVVVVVVVVLSARRSADDVHLCRRRRSASIGNLLFREMRIPNLSIRARERRGRRGKNAARTRGGEYFASARCHAKPILCRRSKSRRCYFN